MKPIFFDVIKQFIWKFGSVAIRAVPIPSHCPNLNNAWFAIVFSHVGFTSKWSIRSSLFARSTSFPRSPGIIYISSIPKTSIVTTQFTQSTNFFTTYRTHMVRNQRISTHAKDYGFYIGYKPVLDWYRLLFVIIWVPIMRISYFLMDMGIRVWWYSFESIYSAIIFIPMWHNPSINMDWYDIDRNNKLGNT